MAAPTPYSSSPTYAYSIDPYLSTDINALLAGIKWGENGVGTGASLYYSFPTSNNPALWDQSSDAYLYASGYETYAGFRGLSITQQTITTTILESWASVANINLIRVNTESASEVGDIRIAFTADGYMDKFTYAYAYFPGPSYGGDVWLNVTQPTASGNNFNPGGFGYHTILHEIGHAIGLEHSFGGFYTLSNTNYDSFKYTVMSYSDAPMHQDRGYSSFYPTTPMLLDIQAIQHIYGANTDYNAGDNLYIFNGTSTYYQTIWDAGGIDTFQYISNTGGTINLEAGSFSVLGQPIRLDIGSYQYDNVAIAYNVLIENAIGGNGHDKLYGNAFVNYLEGGYGNDSLYGNSGNDKLNGGAGNDYLDGGFDKDIMEGGLGSDTYIVDDIDDAVLETLALSQLGGIDLVKSSIDFTLIDHVENLTLTDGSVNGGTAALNGTGNALNNTLTGNAGNNTLDGAAGVDTLIGGLGDDTYLVDLVQTGTNAATYRVALQDRITEATGIGSGTDTVKLRGNFDHLNATTLALAVHLENLDASATGTTKLNLTGNTLANTMTGNAADNILDGGVGVDSLIGGLGNDTYMLDLKLSGTGVSANVNTFDDTVTESNGTTDGVDTIKLRGAATLTNASNLVLDGQWASIENLDASATGATKLNLTGNDADNFLTGNAANNTLVGGGGMDVLFGGAGADIMIGGEGVDLYVVENIGDVVIEQPSEGDLDMIDSLISFDLSTKGANVEYLNLAGTAAINGTGNDLNNGIFGNAATNTLIGGAGDDTLDGGAGNDTLNGGADNDTLIGGSGNDVLTGGIGADTFVWELADKGTNGRPAIDRITDFNSAEDRLDLRDLLDGESSGNILNYIDISNSTTAGVTNTEIRISNTGGFTSGTFAASAENQHITLAGVNLLSGTNEADLLANLISQNKLIID